MEFLFELYEKYTAGLFVKENKGKKGKKGKKNNFIEKDKPVAYTTAIECETDFIMYELYGLTQEEIEIVEGS